MTGITSSLSALVQSILDIFTSIVNAIFSSVKGVFAVAGTLVGDVAAMAQGLVAFFFSEFSSVSFDFPVEWSCDAERRWGLIVRVHADNIVIIGVLVAAFVGYTAYVQRQGKSIKTS